MSKGHLIEKTPAVIVNCASESCVVSPLIQRTAPNMRGQVATEVIDNQRVSTSVTEDGGEPNVLDDVTSLGPQTVTPVTSGDNDSLQQPVSERNGSTSTGHPSPQHYVTTTSSGHG